MIDVNRLLPAIEALYGAALGAASWSAALAELGDAAGADHLILHVEAAVPFVATARIDERDLARALAVQPEVRHDLPGFDTVPDGQVVVRSSMMPDREYARSAHYNEMIRPLGGFHGLVARVRTQSQGSSLVLCRSEHRGDFAPAESSLIRSLLPQLGMAVDILAMTIRAGQTARGLESLLEGMREAVVISDRWLRPLLANAAAQRLLEAADGLVIGCSGLLGATPEDTRRLRAAVAAAGEWPTRLRLSRLSGRPPLLLRIVPAATLMLGAGRAGTLAIFVDEPDAIQPIDRDAVAEAFGLTRREAEIAALVAGGTSPATIAARLDLGVPSVRVYLTRIFHKTGTHSQAALVALLRGFV